MMPTETWAEPPNGLSKWQGPDVVCDPAFTLPLAASVFPSVKGVIMVPAYRVYCENKKNRNTKLLGVLPGRHGDSEGF